ncbi:MAG: hypothetical protein HXS46_14190 [Theionarchaea archaeon]|nr:MAG: hypothetical protein AYK18_04550 [Theionarchaea archaeon DG-70]MBU7011834.1 hypothetical protein [Theionarchaea archaeon]
MPNELDVEVTITEVLIEPLGEILRQVGSAVAETQILLDLNSIATETELAARREEFGYDLHATWYHLPEVELELKMSLSIHREEEKKEGQTVGWKPPILCVAPLNASYRNLFSYDVAGTSVLKVKMVSIPSTSPLPRE